MNVSAIWNQSLKVIEEKIGTQAFDTWFRSVSLDSVKGKEITLRVPNRFFGQWLREHYQDVLRDVLGPLMGYDTVDIQWKTDDARVDESADNGGEEVGGQSSKRRRANQLNPKYTFEKFVVGGSNQFARAACLAVAEKPAKAYNPLFIYGGVGLGKTHLLNAIGITLYAQSGMRIVYVSSEQFTNEVVHSIRYDKMVEFRRKYRSAEILLIDDVQFIAGKERTQEELFHTFNTLYEAQKQIVLSSDCFPKDMSGMEARLQSRFTWGLIADIQPPDLETRVAILQKKSDAEGMKLSDEIAHFIASHVRSNIRELESCLIRLGAFSSLTGEPITMDLTKEVLRDLLSASQRRIDIAEVQNAVATRFGVKIADMKSKRRTKVLVFPRQLAMYLSRDLTELSYPEIGRHFGGKDHTTIMHACKKIEKEKQEGGSVALTIDALTRSLRLGS
ncbi:MAG TPA: chromosomal replication initiator protein DnaA [Nitrospirales bacterium]|nr:chromosomal replication initiator protein DnaA [Nitrospirales bacterium]HIO21399.1 chromosomal replication initiator protein DnaA [Nitrospirales bacterium]